MRAFIIGCICFDAATRHAMIRAHVADAAACRYVTATPPLRRCRLILRERRSRRHTPSLPPLPLTLFYAYVNCFDAAPDVFAEFDASAA